MGACAAAGAGRLAMAASTAMVAALLMAVSITCGSAAGAAGRGEVVLLFFVLLLPLVFMRSPAVGIGPCDW
ncbi:hypothetical protein GCM10012319_31790 [Comamonas sp. KCTC 72670]|nr:hypothetical protein GCM10012319_31790 [Comamonas sp. KCTC 72670]